MPRKAKDEEVKKEKVAQTLATTAKSKKEKKTNIEVEEKTTSIKKASKKATSKTSSTKKSVSSKKKTPSKATTSSKVAASSKSSKTSPSKVTKATPKVDSTKTTTARKATTKKTAAAKKPTTAKSTTTKKTSKKTTTKKTASKKLTTAMEYYDLPTTYQKTVVKILAQTPSSLFVYWEISEKDKLNLQKEYGVEFFQNTKPFLIIYNETMNYSFEVEINDYANSWYVHIHDSDCKYTIVLARKSIQYQQSIPTSYINITSSNQMSIPNDHILFDRLGKTVFFRDVKSNVISKKDISSLSFISNIGRIYNVYDLYKEIYKNELNGDELGMNLSSSRI